MEVRINDVTKLIALLSVFGMTLLISVATMVYGYGVHPQSWGWIVGAGFFGNVFLHYVARKVIDDGK